MVAVELQEGGHVDIAHAVAVGHHHRPVAEMPSRPPDASAGEAVEACVDARHPPTEFVVLLEVTDGLGPAQLDGEVRRHGPVVQEVLTDDVAEIPEGEHEVVLAG